MKLRDGSLTALFDIKMIMLNLMSKASNTLSVGEETDSVVGVRTSIRLEQARTSGSFQVTDWFSNFDTTYN